MANGNIFLTKTDSKILPLISQFTNYLYKYMDVQSELADKVYGYQKQKFGESLSLKYMNQLKEAKTAEDVTAGFANAYAGLIKAGVGEFAPQVGQYADLRAKELGIKEENKLYEAKFNALTKALTSNEFKFGEGTMTGDKISSMIASQTNNPRLRYELFKDAVEGGALKTTTSLSYSPDLRNFYATDELTDATGRVITRPGEQPVKKPIIQSGNDYYYDVGAQQGKVDSQDIIVSGDVSEKISALKYQDYWKRITDQRIRDNKSSTGINIAEKTSQEFYRKGLLNFVNTVNAAGIGGSLADKSRFKVLGLDPVTQAWGMGTQLNTPVDFNSKTPDEWRDVTQSMFQTTVLKDFMGKKEVPLEKITFDVLPTSEEERKTLNTKLTNFVNKFNKNLDEDSPYDKVSVEEFTNIQVPGSKLNPDVIEEFYNIDPSGRLFKSLYDLYKLQKIEKGGYLTEFNP